MAKEKQRSAHDRELEQYLQEISQFPLLNPEEEQELAQQISKGEKDARDRMVLSNLRLVVSIAKHYSHRGMPLLDLIEEGNLGLLKAVGRFSPKHGCKFATYASWWIKQTIRRALINKVKSVRVPAYMVEIMGRWRKTESQLGQSLGREPTPDEVGTSLNIPITKHRAIQQALSASGSQSRGGEPAGEKDLEDVLANMTTPQRPEGILAQFDQEDIHHALELVLTDRERKILELRFGLGGDESLTLERIGERIGLTRERVRQIENQALQKLNFFMMQREERDETRRLEARRRRRKGAAAKVPHLAGARRVPSSILKTRPGKGHKRRLDGP